MSEVIRWMKNVKYRRANDNMFLSDMDIRVTITNRIRHVTFDSRLRVWTVESTSISLEAERLGCNTCESTSDCVDGCDDILRNRDITTRWLSSWSPALGFASNSLEFQSIYPYREWVQVTINPPSFEFARKEPFVILRRIIENEDENPLEIPVCFRDPNLVQVKSLNPDVVAPPENLEWTDGVIYIHNINGFLRREFIKWFGDRPEEELTNVDRKLLGI